MSAVARHSSPFLTLAHPALPIKLPCSPFRTETDFVQVGIQVKQPAVVGCQKRSIPNWVQYGSVGPMAEEYGIYTSFPRITQTIYPQVVPVLSRALLSYAMGPILPNYVKLDLFATCTEASERIAGPTCSPIECPSPVLKLLLTL